MCSRLLRRRTRRGGSPLYFQALLPGPFHLAMVPAMTPSFSKEPYKFLPLCASIRSSGNLSLRQVDVPVITGSGYRSGPAGILPDNPWICAAHVSHQSSEFQTLSGKPYPDRHKMPDWISSQLISPRSQNCFFPCASTNYCMVAAKKEV